jgi:hypothetical protein
MQILLGPALHSEKWQHILLTVKEMKILAAYVDILLINYFHLFQLVCSVVLFSLPFDERKIIFNNVHRKEHILYNPSQSCFFVSQTTVLYVKKVLWVQQYLFNLFYCKYHVQVTYRFPTFSGLFSGAYPK